MRLIPRLLFILSVLNISCQSKNDKEVLVSYTHPEIEYWGRIDSTDVGANLYWSGTSIAMNFEGESIYAMLQDETGDNYYNVMVDNNEPVLLRPDTTQQYYQLADPAKNNIINQVISNHMRLM